MTEQTCPQCGARNTDNWPLTIGDAIVDGGCQLCWEAETGASWSQMVESITPLMQAANPDQRDRTAYYAAYYAARREHCKAVRAAYARSHKDATNARSAAWRKAHPERHKASAKKSNARYWAAHREEISARRRAQYRQRQEGIRHEASV